MGLELEGLYRSYLRFESKSVFCAFVDMEKCFDRIDRDLLLYKLLEFNIDGKLYWCIKSFYGNNLHFMKTIFPVLDFPQVLPLNGLMLSVVSARGIPSRQHILIFLLMTLFCLSEI